MYSHVTTTIRAQNMLTALQTSPMLLLCSPGLYTAGLSNKMEETETQMQTRMDL